jgi:hypothetical protein
MVKPNSFSTICTSTCAFECVGLLLSLSVFHPNETIYIMCDTKTKQTIDEMTPSPKLNMVFLVDLDEYSGYDRIQMVARDLWSQFQMTKSRVIAKALETEKDTLLLDSDIIITGVIDDIDDTKDLGVSPQFLRKDILDKTGIYNGGMLWTKNKDIPGDWIRFTENSRYYDQASIEDLVAKYSHFEFGENYNVQCWRLTLSEESPDDIVSHFATKKSVFLYKDKPVKMIHTHFLDGRFDSFNKLIIQHLVSAKNYRVIAIIFRVIHKRWIITVPKQPMIGMGKHKNDSYRELPLLMKLKNKDVDLQFSEETIHCWLEPNILMYDRPTLQWVDNEVSHASLVLLGNGDVKVEGRDSRFAGLTVKPWIFWPRKPMLLEKILTRHGSQLYADRSIESIFIGNYENSVQERFRKTGDNWQDVITEFHCTEGSEHKFSHEEYLMKLRDTKYGLCLRGYGSKCHREVELMAFGTVPIMTPGVTVDSFMEPLIENVHYIKVAKPSEVPTKLASITEVQWTEMSEACYEWYQRNVYSKNCWNNMITHILYK